MDVVIRKKEVKLGFAFKGSNKSRQMFRDDLSQEKKEQVSDKLEELAKCGRIGYWVRQDILAKLQGERKTAEVQQLKKEQAKEITTLLPGEDRAKP